MMEIQEPLKHLTMTFVLISVKDVCTCRSYENESLLQNGDISVFIRLGTISAIVIMNTKFHLPLPLGKHHL